MRRIKARSLIEATREEAANLIRAVAEPSEFGDTTPICIARAASRLGWSYGRAEDIWRKEARRIDVHEMDALRGDNSGSFKEHKGIRVRIRSEKKETVEKRSRGRKR